MIRFLFMIGFTAFAVQAWAADAPSFDCAKASSLLEKTICARPVLAAADRELNTAYSAALHKLPQSGQKILRDSQRDWLKTVQIMCLNRVYPQAGTEGYNFECLIQKYSEQAEYFYQKAIIALPNGKILLRRQKIAARDSDEYNRDPDSQICLGPNLCLGITTLYAPTFLSSRLAAALPKDDVRDQGLDTPGESGSDFEIVVATPTFISIREQFGRSSPFSSPSSHGEFTYTIDLRRERRLTLDTLFKPEASWRDYVVNTAVEAMPLEDTESCGGRPNWSPRQWYRVLLSEYGWHLTETELVFSYETQPQWPSPCSISLPLSSLKKFMRPDAIELIDWRKSQ